MGLAQWPRAADKGTCRLGPVVLGPEARAEPPLPPAAPPRPLAPPAPDPNPREERRPGGSCSALSPQRRGAHRASPRLRSACIRRTALTSRFRGWPFDLRRPSGRRGAEGRLRAEDPPGRRWVRRVPRGQRLARSSCLRSARMAGDAPGGHIPDQLAGPGSTRPPSAFFPCSASPRERDPRQRPGCSRFASLSPNGRTLSVRLPTV